MANRTATLYIRITTKYGRNSYCKPVYLSKGRLKPHYAMVDGEPEHHPEGVYYIRFGTGGGKQRFESVGMDAFVALDKLGEAQRGLREQQRHPGSAVLRNTPPETGRMTIEDAVERYFRNLRSQGKDSKTIRAYKVAIQEFQQSCDKKFMDEIGRQDLLDCNGMAGHSQRS